MIRKECFTKEWIETVRDRFKYNDVNLIEKVIRAFSLVEMLSESGCPYIWKGGSCLMLLLGSGLHRLSIDVDIVCPPGTNIEQYLAKFPEYGFTGRETIEREQRFSSVPKSHEKLHYKVAYLSQTERTESILLDVLYEYAQYEKVEIKDIKSPFILLDGAPLTVKVPSVDDILADKLTAFAPNTSGIPYFKNGKPKFIEIIKQLYDIGRLFDAMDGLETICRVFNRIAPIELAYKHLSDEPTVIFQDIQTGFSTFKERLLKKLLWGSIFTFAGLLGLAMLLIAAIVGGEANKDVYAPVILFAAPALAVGISFLLNYFIGKNMLAKEIEAEKSSGQKNNDKGTVHRTG